MFMTYESLASIKDLDTQRLRNQIYRECKTLYTGGWRYHPAAKIWKNYKHALALYALHGLEELWYNRGYKYPKWVKYFNDIADSTPNTGVPDLVGNPEFHASHRSQLLLKGICDHTFKLYKHLGPRLKEDWTISVYESIWDKYGQPSSLWYDQFGWTEQPGAIAYIWE